MDTAVEKDRVITQIDNKQVQDGNETSMEFDKNTCSADQINPTGLDVFKSDSVSLLKQVDNGKRSESGIPEVPQGGVNGAGLSILKAEVMQVPKHFCTVCNQHFTRSHSLSRHMMRKHPGMKIDNDTNCQKRSAIDSAMSNPQILKKRCNSPNSSLPKRAGTKARKLRVVLTKRLPSQRKANISQDEEEKIKSLSPTSEEEKALLGTMKDLCMRLQKMGRHILVITTDPTHSQWLGSDYGVEFAKENADVISSFFNYCKDKNGATQNETDSDKIKENSTTCDNIKFEIDGDSDDDYFDDDSNENDEKNNEIVNNDDSDNDYAEAMEEDDDAGDDFDDDHIDREHSSRQLPQAYRQYLENKEKMFQDLAAGLHEAELARDVSSLLKKPVVAGSSRAVCIMVEDLNRGRYKCSTCGYNFLWKCHLELHQIKNPHCDRVKDFKMSKRDILKESITFQSPDTGVEITTTFQELLDSQTVRPLVCVICGKKSFRDRGMFQRHLITHNEAGTFECNICCEGFSKIGLLSTHLKTHFRKPFECHKCWWRFTDSEKLGIHTENGCQSVSLINNKEKDSTFMTTVYRCNICSAEVTGIEALREHVRSEHDKKIGEFDCVLCDKKFPETKLYNSHLLTHNKVYPCPFCRKKFGTKSDAYFSHIKSHKQVEEFPFVCDICGEQYKKRRYLENHRRIHTGERPFICEHEGCGKAFRSRDGLDQHKWCHKNQHFLCDFCGRKFKKPSFLRNHRRTHTVDWRYPCIYCPEKFRSLRPFKQHLAKDHPGCVEEVKEKFKIILHACRLCPKVFYDKEDHTTHMYRHNGVKPFPCDYCGKTFSDKSNLLQHRAIHSGGKKLKCSWCSRKFKEEKFLESHVQRLHTRKPGEQSVLAVEDKTVAEDIDELRENTLQIIEETIRGNATF